MFFSKRPLVRNSPDERVVAPIRQEAIRMVEGLETAGVQTRLTREQVDAALAFYVLGEEGWYSLFGAPLTSDASRIWERAEVGSQILLREGRNHLVVRDATWLQRLEGELSVEPHSFYYSGSGAKKPAWTEIPHGEGDWISPRPDIVTNGHLTIGSSYQLENDVKERGINTRNNIGLFIPAPFENGGARGR